MKTTVTLASFFVIAIALCFINSSDAILIAPGHLHQATTAGYTEITCGSDNDVFCEGFGGANLCMDGAAWSGMTNCQATAGTYTLTRTNGTVTFNTSASFGASYSGQYQLTIADNSASALGPVLQTTLSTTHERMYCQFYWKITAGLANNNDGFGMFSIGIGDPATATNNSAWFIIRRVDASNYKIELRHYDFATNLITTDGSSTTMQLNTIYGTRLYLRNGISTTTPAGIALYTNYNTSNTVWTQETITRGSTQNEPAATQQKYLGFAAGGTTNNSLGAFQMDMIECDVNAFPSDRMP